MRGGGGYPIPQYRKKNRQIPKYRVKNRRNTDTAFVIGHVYLKLYPSRVSLFIYLKHQYAPEINLRHCEKTLEDLYQYNDRKARSLERRATSDVLSALKAGRDGVVPNKLNMSRDYIKSGKLKSNYSLFFAVLRYKDK